MDNAQAYLTKVLRSCRAEVEGFLSEKNIDRLSRMVAKVEKAKSIDAELKRIYCVTGLESFAVTCMWIADRTRKAGVKDEEYESDRERIARTLSPFIEWDEEPPASPAKPVVATLTVSTTANAPVPAQSMSVPPVFLQFAESLQVLIMQTKESMEDVDAFENAFDHLQEVCDEKIKDLQALKNSAINDFTAILSEILQIATTRKIRGATKVIELLTTTAQNLEKIIGTGAKFDVAGLANQTIAMRNAARSF